MAYIHEYNRYGTFIPMAYNIKKSDLITRDLNPVNAKDIDESYAALLAEGYTIYDVTTNGGFYPLTTKTAGYYICVWTVEPKILASPVTGTSPSTGTTTTIKFNTSTTSSVDDYYNGMEVEWTNGLAANQYNIITDYVGSTHTATVARTYTTAPTSTATYSIGNPYNIADSYITPHYVVTVTGWGINSNYAINKYDNTLYLRNSIIGYFSNQLIIMRSNVYLSNSTLTAMQSIVFESCDIIYMKYQLLDSCYFRGCLIEPVLATATQFNFNTTTTYRDYGTIFIKDCKLKLQSASNTLTFYTYVTGTFNNLVIDGAGLTKTINFSGNGMASSIIKLDNVLFENAENLTVSISVNNCVSHASTIYIDGSFPTFSIYKGGVLLNRVNLQRQTFLSDDYAAYTLDTSAITNDANFIGLNATLTVSPENYTGTGYQYTRLYYTLAFDSSMKMDDCFKTMFSQADSLLIVRRDDWLETIADYTINNLQFLDESDNVINYRNNENYFILTDEGAILSWYNGRIYPTKFNTPPLWETDYTPAAVFQLLEPPDKPTYSMSFLNYYHNDMPIEGSVQFRDVTNSYVLY